MIAVRRKASGLLGEFQSIFGGEPPFNLEALASFRGLRTSADAPQFSDDSELAPQKDGTVALRVNRERPLTRQRFSVGHELGHTLFSDFHLKVRCRKGTERAGSDRNDEIETLCDIAAAEFLFPAPWFPDRAKRIAIASHEILQLASDFVASREATLRRLLEVRTEPLAVVFFSWKLKPTEKRALSVRLRQPPLFRSTSSGPTPKLRVDYGVTNEAFRVKQRGYIAKDKSILSGGPIYEASVGETAADARVALDLGSLQGDFDVCAFPIFTPDDAPWRESGTSVAALLSPA